MSMGPGRADSPLQQIRRAGSGFTHRFLTGGQVVEHRGVGAGELPAPVLAWFEEATGTPAGSIVFVGGFPWKGGVAPSQTIRRMRYRLPTAADLS